MEKKNNCFFAFVQSEELHILANTDKYIAPNMSNLSDLNDEEYISLMANFLSYLTASNVPVIITGICYLKLLYEQCQYRFKEFIFLAIESGGVSMDDEDDYHQLSSLLIMCDYDLYRQFLLKESKSNNPEIQNDANEKRMLDNDYFTQKMWYKTYCSEYIEFKHKLGM